MFNFSHPEYLFAIMGVALFAYFLYLKNNKKIIFGPLNDLHSVYTHTSIYFKLYYIIIFLILSVFIIILSGPRITETNEKVVKNGVDIEIVLDTSLSMKATDLQPTRLTVAKKMITKFLDSSEGHRVGLVIFAGKPFSSLPLNFDYNLSKSIIEKISVDTINQSVGHLQGTAIGDALLLASDTFNEDSHEREKVIILLTDGVSNIGYHPLEAIKYLQSQKGGDTIKIYTIGIGSEKQSYITHIDAFGVPQRLGIDPLDDTHLKILASKTGGKYYRATDNKSFEMIFKEISELEKKDFESEMIRSDEYLSKYFVYLSLVLFLIFVLLGYRKRIF